MKKIYFITIFIFILLCYIIYIFKFDIGKKVIITGNVTNVTEGKKKTILLNNVKSEDFEFDVLVVHTTDKTKIATEDEIKENDVLIIEIEDRILESYPSQAYAIKIKIKE